MAALVTDNRHGDMASREEWLSDIIDFAVEAGGYASNAPDNGWLDALMEATEDTYQDTYGALEDDAREALEWLAGEGWLVFSDMISDFVVVADTMLALANWIADELDDTRELRRELYKRIRANAKN